MNRYIVPFVACCALLAQDTRVHHIVVTAPPKPCSAEEQARADKLRSEHERPGGLWFSPACDNGNWGPVQMAKIDLDGDGKIELSDGFTENDLILRMAHEFVSQADQSSDAYRQLHGQTESLLKYIAMQQEVIRLQQSQNKALYDGLVSIQKILTEGSSTKRAWGTTK